MAHKQLTPSIHWATVRNARFPRPALFIIPFVLLHSLQLNAATTEPMDTGKDDSPPALVFHGFGTLGIARSSTDQGEFVRDLSQPDGVTREWSAKIDSLLGLQANYRAGEQLEAVAQAVSHYRYDGSFRPDLTWAFLKFDPSANLSLRGGRLGTEFYMRADSRLVGYSYLPVRPPGDYYGVLPFSHIEGMDVLLTVPLGSGLMRGKLFSGINREKAPLADRLWDLDGSRMSGGHLDYQSGRWQWRLGYAQIRFNHDLPLDDLKNALNATGIASAQAAARELSVENRVARLYSAGIVYDDGPLQLQLMLSTTRRDGAIFENARSGYLIGGYRLGATTPYAGYSWVKSSPKQLSTGLPDIAPLAQLNSMVALAMADSHSDQHTFILGTRWDFQRNMALKAQLDMIRGSSSSIFPYRNEQAGFDGNINMFSLSLDFVF